MNTFVKGAIAAGAATVLLLGGAGTFALWNQTATVASTTISSGTLTLAASTGTWNTNPTKWVPGDSFTYSTNLTVVAIGDNLNSKLVVTPGSLGTGALASALTVTMAVTPTSGLTVNPLNANEFTVATKASGSYTVPVVVTVTFPSTVSGTTAQADTVTLSGISFSLNQY